MSGTRPNLLAGTTPLVVEMRTDWHVGAGHGVPGDVDAVVRRDPDGLPYLPGTTLTGVVRDACRVVARALDDGAEGVWQRWAQAVFGADPTIAAAHAGRTPRPALVAFEAAHLPTAVRSAIAARPELISATVLARPGVRIDEETGRAQDDMLRMVELARGGVDLHGACTRVANVDEDDLTAVSALVVLGLAWCDRLGGSRRRGPGEVAFRIDGQPAADVAAEWAAWLAMGGWTPREPPDGEATFAPLPPAVTPSGNWVELDVRIVTLAPVRVTRGVRGNAVLGHDHLPGSVLLPWLSDRWGADPVRAAVAADTISVSAAHPAVDGRRGLPVPFTVFRSKGGDGEVGVGAPADGERPVRDRWTYAPAAGAALPLQARTTVHAGHNQVDPDSQRPNSDVGIHTVEAIPARTALYTRIRLDASSIDRMPAGDGITWWERLAGPARLGARRRGEYGNCEVTVGAPRPAVTASVPRPGRIVLWVVSDVLVRDRGLRWSSDPGDLERALRDRLGDGVRLAAVTARIRRHDGWQASWGLPRPSLIGFAAGSVIELDAPDGVDPDGWADLVLRGLGDRRAEGFGEVLADPELLITGGRRVVVDVPAAAVEGPAGDLEDAGRALLDRLDRATRRDRITAAVVRLRGSEPYAGLAHAFGMLSRSQRSTWRAIATDAAVAGLPARIRVAARSWADNQGSKRATQRTVAAQLLGLAGDGSGAVGITGLVPDAADPADVAFAVAVLVTDVVDQLAREST